MTDTEDKEIFLELITINLREHPEWLSATFRAVITGTDAAMQTMRDRVSKKDQAFLSALGLADKGRLSKNTKDLLNQNIVDVIYEPNACQLEKSALKRAREGVK